MQALRTGRSAPPVGSVLTLPPPQALSALLRHVACDVACRLRCSHPAASPGPTAAPAPLPVPAGTPGPRSSGAAGGKDVDDMGARARSVSPPRLGSAGAPPAPSLGFARALLVVLVMSRGCVIPAPSSPAELEALMTAAVKRVKCRLCEQLKPSTERLWFVDAAWEQLCAAISAALTSHRAKVCLRTWVRSMRPVFHSAGAHAARAWPSTV